MDKNTLTAIQKIEKEATEEAKKVEKEWLDKLSKADKEFKKLCEEEEAEAAEEKKKADELDQADAMVLLGTAMAAAFRAGRIQLARDEYEKMEKDAMKAITKAQRNIKKVVMAARKEIMTK